jgi:hypothetical protein
MGDELCLNCMSFHLKGIYFSICVCVFVSLLNMHAWLGVVVHTCNLSMQVTKAGGSGV